MLYHRVLITGANGLLGQALVTRLGRRPDYDVLATARDEAPRFSNGSFGYTPLDVTRSDDVYALFEDFAPTVVINCAALTQVDRCENEREACWAVNAEAVETLADACTRYGTRLVQVSTDFVFDGKDGPYREDARPNPINFYGKSKLAGENAARGAGPDKWAVARTVLVYGTGDALTSNNIVLWLLGKLSCGEEVHVVTDQHRTPTYVVDLADGIERIVRFQKTGIYHLSGHKLLSVYDFARIVAETFDLDASLIHPTDASRFQQPADRPPRTGFIILKAASELGYKPRSIRQALHHLSARLDLSVPNR